MIAQQDYPPPPWHLNATVHVAIWRIPITEFPLAPESPIRPVRVARHVIVAAGFVNYGEGSAVEYSELFLAVLARAAGRAGVNVPRIWVDSPVSLRAGRELWSIPKQLATFRQTSEGELEAVATITEAPIAHARFRCGSALPFRMPTKLTVLQHMGDRLQCTPVSATSAIAFGSSTWSIPSGSALSVLRGRRPLISMALRNARIRFGA